MRLVAGLVALGLALPAIATNHADDLAARARTLNLAGRDEWRLLLHYRPRLSGGFESTADDPAFFLAPNGKTDPAAELEATLRAFFLDTAETDKVQNPQCRFIARYRWLKRELGFDPAQLPEQPCRRFHEWLARLAPASLTLVFPTAFLNSPASMYGHTLLRIDGSDQTDRTRLLAYAINFAADTPENNGIAFAYKGLFGRYAGRFSMLPYYVKVAEYSDLESRDIWEYELDLSVAEIDRLLQHVWELGPIRFDYWFLDENCSYQLLALLDVARPSLHLSDRFPLWAIPVDTVRVVTETPGLLRRAVYRPSRTTQLKAATTQLPAGDIRLADDIALARKSPDDAAVRALPAPHRAQTLDLAFELLDYRRLAGKARQPDVAERLRALLIARSQVDGPELPVPPTPEVRPDEAHRSARVSLGGGTSDANGLQELRFRPALHDLLDPLPGFQRGAQIEFANLTLRRENDDGVKLQKLTGVSVKSFASRDALLRPRAWHFMFGLDRTRAGNGDRPLFFEANGGTGLARDFLGDKATAWATLDAGMLGSGRFDPGLTIGGGVSAGVVIEPVDGWRVMLSGRALHYLLEGPGERLVVSLDQSLRISRDVSLRIEANEKREFGIRWSTVGAFVDWYF